MTAPAPAAVELEIDPGETLYMAGVALVVCCIVVYAYNRFQRPPAAN